MDHSPFSTSLLPPASQGRFFVVLHVRRSVFPLDVFVGEWTLWKKLHCVLVMLKYYMVPTYVTLFICFDP
jgi:hypothetical protein